MSLFGLNSPIGYWLVQMLLNLANRYVPTYMSICSGLLGVGKLALVVMHCCHSRSTINKERIGGHHIQDGNLKNIAHYRTTFAGCRHISKPSSADCFMDNEVCLLIARMVVMVVVLLVSLAKETIRDIAYTVLACCGIIW